MWTFIRKNWIFVHDAKCHLLPGYENRSKQTKKFKKNFLTRFKPQVYGLKKKLKNFSSVAGITIEFLVKKNVGNTRY